MVDIVVALSQNTGMGNSARPPIEREECLHFGERLHALLCAIQRSATDAEEATGIRADKISRWKKEAIEKRPLARLDEAWKLARYIASKFNGVSSDQVLRYLADDDMDEELPKAVLRDTWEAKLADLPQEPLELVRSLPLEPKPSAKRPDRKHLPR